MKHLNIRYLVSILLPLAVGMLSSFFSREGMILYNQMAKPPLSPPAILFPIAWTILYVLMGTAAYFIWTANLTTDLKTTPIYLYLIQLGMNFFWSILFFALNMHTLALFWLIGMYIAVILCTGTFFQVSKMAGWLMIPYNLWMAFALYLNAATVLMKW